VTRADLPQLLAEKRLIVCVGPGGVGKTTTAASLAARAARSGRRTLVCTIDPAPRLADALGMKDLGGEPRAVGADAAATLGLPDPRLLSVARLDTAQAFARLVEEKVGDPEMRRRILTNRIYREITTSLTGSQEYAATLALYDLSRRGLWDLIVLDTPPTANALDFLAAPKRIADAIGSPAIQWFARKPEGGGFLFQRLRAGSALAVSRIAKFVGSEFLEDVAAFLVDFQSVLSDFLVRAREVEALLRQPDVAFFLVLVPEAPAVDEALGFERQLRAAGVPVAGFIANRVQPAPGLIDVDALMARLTRQPALARFSPSDVERAAERLARTAVDLRAVADGERRELGRLANEAPHTRTWEVPRLPHEAETLASLVTIGDTLAGANVGPNASAIADATLRATPPRA
jgi:anion-transporting  ArsA/GET3 family ATPase